MVRTVSPRTGQLREQILTALRVHGGPLPLSTLQVCEALAAGNCTGRCHGTCTGWCWYGKVYPQLRALVRLGVVEQVHRPEMRAAYWAYAGDSLAADDEIIDLDILFARSSGDAR